ncbi:MAG: M23 family metallopeptidase [Eubacteriales bacterium]|nr:M23 family metallopeptidase [Lachnospiraceae bacterium]MDO5127159.1 M23 family metallopeptidase [Eubacteriales bacterium]
MKQVWGFLKTKGFYIALGTGLLAFAGLMAMYDYKGNKESAMQNEQAIDLNQPVQSGDMDESFDQALQEDDVVANSGNDAVVTSKEAEEENSDLDNEVAGNSDAWKEDEVSDKTVEDDETVETAGVPVQSEANELSGYDGTQVLAWPIVGIIVMPYSMDQTIYFSTLDCYRCNPGMMIAGNEGDAVYAIYDGTVCEIKDSKEFGKTVTIDLGNGYMATYGQMQNVSVSEGDTIAKAQQIGEVGPVSSYYEKEGSHLYFAMTKDDEPVNPIVYMQ